MRIDIDLFKKNFSVVDCKSISHRSSKLYSVLPFTASTSPEYIITNMRNVINGYIRNVCGIDKLTVLKDDVLKKCNENINCIDSDKTYFENLIYTMFFNESDELKPSNIILRKYSYCESREQKIANFLADVLGNKDDISSLINDAQNNLNYNAIDNFFIQQLPNITDKEYKVEYDSLITFPKNMFLNDIKYLFSDNDLLDSHIVDLFELYYFDYVSQACIKLGQFFQGDPEIRIPLYYALDWKKITKDRKCCTEGWKLLDANIKKMFSHQVVLEMINQNSVNDHVNYFEIGIELAENPDKDYEYAEQIKAVSQIYVESINDCGDALRNLTKDDKCHTKTESELQYLFNCVYTQFKFSKARKRANDACADQYKAFCKQNNLKNRGSLGAVLNLTQHKLIFLTKLAIGDSDTKRLIDVFTEFEKRGVFLDNISKDDVVKYYEKLNIIEKKSDSGDALYVKRIL